MNSITLFKRWNGIRSGLLEGLDLLSDQQLDFRPREGLWSLRETAIHVASAEEGWFHYEVTRELPGWEAADFQAGDYPTREQIKQLLVEVHARVVARFAECSDEELSQPLQLSWGGSMTLEDVIWHVIEHEIHHRGEIYLMLGLLGMEAPDV